MSITCITSTRFKVKKAEPFNHVPKWRNNKPSPFQSNTLHAIRNYLTQSRHKSRNEVYVEIEKRWGLQVSELRHYASGGVGSYDWLPRLGCIRVQVGASKIDCRKYCNRYAPCVEIFDTWA